MKYWLTQIDQTTQDFVTTFGSLSDDELNWKPNSQMWSIAQNMDHIITINETYYPIVDAVKKGTYKPPFISKIGFLVSLSTKAVWQAVQPDRKKRMKTFPIWEPAQGNIPPGILDRFATHQEVLKGMIESAVDFVEQGIIISSPANRNITYKLEKAFDIIVAHEQRHFEQAKEVYQLIKAQA